MIALPARACGRGDRHRDAARRPARAARRSSASGRRRRRASRPTWRARDVTREIDVVEEVARFRLEDVPFTLPVRRAMFGTLTREQQLRRRVEDALVGLGFAETYTPSLRPDDDDDMEAAGADLGRADRAADDVCCRASSRRPRRNLDAGVGRDRALRDRARLPPGRRPARRAGARRRDRRRRLLPRRRASSRRCTRR